MNASATIDKKRIELARGLRLSDIDILKETGEGAAPESGAIIVTDGLGDRARAITMLSDLDNIDIYLRAESPDCNTDALILASLGVNTGIVFTPGSPLHEGHADLLTYLFYSLSPHADIEPWSSMARARAEGKYLTPRVSLGTPEAGSSPDADGLYRWQRIMVDGGGCAFCPAMRLCEGFFADRDDHSQCQALMTEAASCIDFSINNDICRQ